MERTGVIYKATSPSGNVYVGKTILSLGERKSKHRTDAKKHTYAFANAINKYGIDGFVWEIIESEIPNCKLNEREVFYIRKLNSYNNGYNSTEGGDFNPMDYEKNRKKVSEKRKGVKATIVFCGEDNHSSKLTWKEVFAIRDEYKNTSLTHEDLSSKYNISRRSIGNVVNNITWIDDKYITTTNKQNKLTASEVYEIRVKYRDGTYTLESLGKKYRVAFQNISLIINNKIFIDEGYKVPDVKSIRNDIISIRDKEICDKYKTGNYIYKFLAEEYKLSVRTISRVLNCDGRLK